MSHRILVVEDDPKLAGLMLEFLESHGFDAEHEARGDRAAQRILDNPPDVVVLDLMLPGLDGIEVCRRVRASSRVPIIMVTARTDDVDQILGLQVGADDYVNKPLRPRLLLARIRALLRRTDTATPQILCLGGLTVNTRERSAVLHNRPLDLTSGEFELLQFLAERPGEVVSREALYVSLRGRPWDGVDRSIDLRVSRLRRKLGDGSPSRWLKSIRGSGYLLIPEL